MKGAFFIVGPTASGKSEVAAEAAAILGGEVVNADAFQIYRGLALLTAQPDTATLGRAPHHLLGAVAIDEEMNAEKFRRLAGEAIAGIQSRGKLAVVAGGSGLYIKALTHGFSRLPAGDPSVRTELNELTLEELRERLIKLDPTAIDAIDLHNRRRVVRALEICLATGKPASAQRSASKVAATDAMGSEKASATAPAVYGVFVFRDRAELYERINRRVQGMFEKAVTEEVRALGQIGTTAAKTIGLSQIRELLGGRISNAQCIAQIQQATRRYAKRQLTWFRRQTNFEPLNLSLLSPAQAVEWITERARRSFA